MLVRKTCFLGIMRPTHLHLCWVLLAGQESSIHFKMRCLWTDRPENWVIKDSERLGMRLPYVSPVESNPRNESLLCLVGHFLLLWQVTVFVYTNDSFGDGEERVYIFRVLSFSLFELSLLVMQVSMSNYSRHWLFTTQQFCPFLFVHRTDFVQMLGGRETQACS